MHAVYQKPAVMTTNIKVKKLKVISSIWFVKRNPRRLPSNGFVERAPERPAHPHFFAKARLR
jgi:hypothetical protein